MIEKFVLYIVLLKKNDGITTSRDISEKNGKTNDFCNSSISSSTEPLESAAIETVETLEGTIF